MFVKLRICLSWLIGYWILLKTVWNGWCAGNIMWSSVWCKAVQKTFNLYLWSHNISTFNLHTSSYYMDLHGKTSDPNPPRPWNFIPSRKVFSLVNTSIIRLCNSTTIGSLLAVSVFSSSFACKLSCNLQLLLFMSQFVGYLYLRFVWEVMEQHWLLVYHIGLTPSFLAFMPCIPLNVQILVLHLLWRCLVQWRNFSRLVSHLLSWFGNLWFFNLERFQYSAFRLLV